MTVFDPNQREVLDALESDYWQTLETTLKVVFDAPPEVALRYRRRLTEAPPLQRALALHDDPLDLATTLIGKSPSPERVALYDKMISPYPSGDVVERHDFKPDDVLSSARRDESSPMVPVKLLNRFLGDLGYQHLEVKAGIAHFALKREAWKRPLPKYIRMEDIPGINADREEVYPLYRVINIFDALSEFAQRRKPPSSIVDRIEKVRNRLLRTLNL